MIKHVYNSTPTNYMLPVVIKMQANVRSVQKCKNIVCTQMNDSST